MQKSLIEAVKENNSDFVWQGLDEPVRVTYMGSETSGHHGHAGRPGSVGGSAPSGYNSPLVQYSTSLENMEAGLIELTTEQSVISDPDSQMAMYHAMGNQKYTIKLTKEEWEIAQGQILTHNHPPGGSPGPSPSDVLAHAQHGVKEMRVVQMDDQGGKWLFRMTANKGRESWVKDRKEFKSFIDETSFNQANKFMKALDAGKITGEQANHEHWHEVWKTVSHKYGFEYERTQLSG